MIINMMERQQIPQVVPECSVVTPLIELHAHLPEIGLKKRASDRTPYKLLMMIDMSIITKVEYTD